MKKVLMSLIILVFCSSINTGLVFSEGWKTIEKTPEWCIEGETYYTFLMHHDYCADQIYVYDMTNSSCYHPETPDKAKLCGGKCIYYNTSEQGQRKAKSINYYVYPGNDYRLVFFYKCVDSSNWETQPFDIKPTYPIPQVSIEDCPEETFYQKSNIRILIRVGCLWGFPATIYYQLNGDTSKTYSINLEEGKGSYRYYLNWGLEPGENSIKLWVKTPFSEPSKPVEKKVNFNVSLEPKDLEFGKSIALQACNGQYVRLVYNSGGALRADNDDRARDDFFELFFIENDKIYLRAINGKYVCAENGGGGALLANRGQASAWETFNLVRHSDGWVSFRTNNNHYICAEGGGGRELTANRSSISEWEKFKIINTDDPRGSRIAIRSCCNGQYVRAVNGGQGELRADSPYVAFFETFERLWNRNIFITWRNYFVSHEGTNIIATRHNEPFSPPRATEEYEVRDAGNGKCILIASNGKNIYPDGTRGYLLVADGTVPDRVEDYAEGAKFEIIELDKLIEKSLFVQAAEYGVVVKFASENYTPYEGINTYPYFTDYSKLDSYNIDINRNLNFTISATDDDGDDLTFIIGNLPSGANLNDNGDGSASFSWTPTSEQTGEYVIDLEVSDGLSSIINEIKIIVSEPKGQNLVVGPTYNTGTGIINNLYTNPLGGSGVYGYFGGSGINSFGMYGNGGYGIGLYGVGGYSIGGYGYNNYNGYGMPGLGGLGLPGIGVYGMPGLSGFGIPGLSGYGMPGFGGFGIPTLGYPGISSSLGSPLMPSFGYGSVFPPNGNLMGSLFGSGGFNIPLTLASFEKVTRLDSNSSNIPETYPEKELLSIEVSGPDMIYDPEFTDLEYYYTATAEFSDGTTEDVTESAEWTIENANTCQDFLNHSTYECERMDNLHKGRLMTCSQKFCKNSWNMCNCSWMSINVKASYTYNGISKEGTMVVDKSFAGILYQVQFL